MSHGLEAAFEPAIDADVDGRDAGPKEPTDGWCGELDCAVQHERFEGMEPCGEDGKSIDKDFKPLAADTYSTALFEDVQDSHSRYCYVRRTDRQGAGA